MAISNYAREKVALLIGGSASTPNLGSCYFSVGSASGTLTVNTTGLLFTWDRNVLTAGVVDMSTAQVVTGISDFSSTELSGLPFRQFGVFVESSGGKAWQVENASVITFDGTNELQIEWSIQVF